MKAYWTNKKLKRKKRDWANLRKIYLQGNVEEHKEASASEQSSLWNRLAFVRVKQRQVSSHSWGDKKNSRQIPQNNRRVRRILANNNPLPSYCSSSSRLWRRIQRNYITGWAGRYTKKLYGRLRYSRKCITRRKNITCHAFLHSFSYYFYSPGRFTSILCTLLFAFLCRIHYGNIYS